MFYFVDLILESFYISIKYNLITQKKATPKNHKEYETNELTAYPILL